MKMAFIPLLVVVAALFAYAPCCIAQAPYESTMLLVQKIFYFHVPSWIAMFSAIAVCGVASAIYLFKGKPAADRLAVSAAELAVLFGADRPGHGPLWARKAWGVWWQWDARLTMALLLELIFVAYLLVRKYGGPGSEKLAAATALFGMANAPFVYKSVNIWRTIHPQTTRGADAAQSDGGRRSLWRRSRSCCSSWCCSRCARGLPKRQAALDDLYLAHED